MAQFDVEVKTEEISRVDQEAFNVLDGQLNAQLRSMALSVEALNDTWRGPNHDAFVAAYESRKQSLYDFQSAFGAMLRSLGEVFREYNNGEQTVSEHIE